MTADETPVAPAMSAEEWAAFLADLHTKRGPYSDEHRAAWAADAHGKMAQHNALLPGGHHGKITREDVEACWHAANEAGVQAMFYMGEHDNPEKRREFEASRSRLLALAAKLAALLPREITDDR